MRVFVHAGGHNQDRDRNMNVHEDVGTQMRQAQIDGRWEKNTGRGKRGQVAKVWVEEEAKGTANNS